MPRHGADVDREVLDDSESGIEGPWRGDKATGRAGDPQSHVGSDAEMGEQFVWAVPSTSDGEPGVISREKVISFL